MNKDARRVKKRLHSILLCVVRLNVVLLNVVAPEKDPLQVLRFLAVAAEKKTLFKNFDFVALKLLLFP